jgi:hypothetical protein
MIGWIGTAELPRRLPTRRGTSGGHKRLRRYLPRQPPPSDGEWVDVIGPVYVDRDVLGSEMVDDETASRQPHMKGRIPLRVVDPA